MLDHKLILFKIIDELGAGIEHFNFIHRLLRQELFNDCIGNFEEPINLYDKDLTQSLWVVILDNLYEMRHKL